MLGVALGALLRNTAGALTSLVALLLVLPGVVSLLPESWSDAISPYLPSNAGQAFMSISSSSDLLSPGAGLAVFVGWVGGPGRRGGDPAAQAGRLIRRALGWTAVPTGSGTASRWAVWHPPAEAAFRATAGPGPLPRPVRWA